MSSAINQPQTPILIGKNYIKGNLVEKLASWEKCHNKAMWSRWIWESKKNGNIKWWWKWTHDIDLNEIFLAQLERTQTDVVWESYNLLKF